IWDKIQKNALHIQNLGKRFSQKFWEQKKNSGVVSLSDLEPLALRLAELFPESAEKFAADWDYWLIDEYQDTSPLQNKLMDLFVKKSAVFYVGDPQQSIYYFRGARSEVFNSRFDSAAGSQIVQEELTTNYRSRPALMRFFNDFFASGPNPFKELAPGREETPSADPEALFFQCEDSKSEIASVCQRVVGLVNRGIELDTIAIIARTNDDLYKISAELAPLNVPTHVHASSQFGIRREILDLRAICAFLLNPHDDESAVTTFRTPWFHIDDTLLAETVRDRKAPGARGVSSLWSALKLNQGNHQTVQKLSALLDHLKLSSLSSTLLEVLQNNGIIDVSQVYDSTGQRESNIWKFVLLLKQAEHTPGFNAVDFLQQWNQLRSALAEEGDAVAALEPNRINLMTIHASKGLQFDHVLVPFLSRSPRFAPMDFFEVDENGRWSVKARDADDEFVSGPFHFQLSARKRLAELEESDRLLYVAATRAKISIAFTMLLEPERDSWHSRFSWNYTKGRHTKSGFTYEVLGASTEPERLIRPPIPPSLKVREKFSLVPAALPARRLAVSTLAATNADEQTEETLKGDFRKIPRDFLSRPVRGVVFHQKMERIQKHMARFNGELSPGFEVDPTDQWVLELTEIPMKEILKQGCSEWPFQISFGSSIVSGQIDLWGQIGNEIWIIDYKTGTSRNLEKAIEQLQVYGWALSKAYPEILNIKLIALFPLEEKFFEAEFNQGTAMHLLKGK
ncbi:MAG: UvrD-helicase domain-containing protein, partial [Bdellovibrionales bacterium]|nr:UvrD-helicase domain-containing protein [Bdellovibrionales bacterium]